MKSTFTFEDLITHGLMACVGISLGTLIGVYAFRPDLISPATPMLEEELYRGMELPAGWEFVPDRNEIHNAGDTLIIIQTNKKSYHYARKN